jgi:hypothetical protein
MNLKVEDLEREIRARPGTEDGEKIGDSVCSSTTSLLSVANANPNSFVLASMKEALLQEQQQASSKQHGQFAKSKSNGGGGLIQELSNNLAQKFASQNSQGQAINSKPRDQQPLCP